MAGGLKLSIAIADYPHVAALKDGSIRIEGIDPTFVTVVPQIAAFRRMVRDLEFDVCELASTTYTIARSYGAPFVALPVFLMRRFHHGGLKVRPDAGIREPRDLEGRKVGVRAYSVTTGVWTRGILMAEHGLDASKVTWVVDDEEHVTQMRLPPNVVQAPQGRSLVAMMASGELAAGFEGNAGLGRAGKPEAGWDTGKAPAEAYPDLFADPGALERDWYRRTNIYPVHGTVVVKDEVLSAHPWAARALSDAFEAAKAAWLARLRRGEGHTADDMKYRGLVPVVGDDPLPYGLAANRPTLAALEATAFAQGLTARRMTPEELFVDP